MENEDISMKMQEFFGGLSQNFTLLEDPVDVAVQIKYFEASYRMNGKLSEEEIFACKDDLFDPNLPVELKKSLLVQLASVPNPEIYRTLEAYAKKPDEDIKDWAKLALQENRLLLESHLLDNHHRQVFISTGLGGKGHKLRYFVVLINKGGDDLKPFQQKVVQDEMQYALQRYDSELENLSFKQRYTTMKVVVPISSDLTKLFREGINECNQFGDFLSSDFLVTNMKELSDEEINEALLVNHPITDDDFPPID